MSVFPKCQIEKITKNSIAKVGAMSHDAKKMADFKRYDATNFGSD